MSRSPSSDRVMPPRRNKDGLGSGFCNKINVARQQLRIDNVWKPTRVRRALAIEHAVDVQEYDLHRRLVDI
jgi:hypothetical protein